MLHIDAADYIALIRRVHSIQWGRRERCPACNSARHDGHKPTCWMKEIERKLKEVGPSSGCSHCKNDDSIHNKCVSFKLDRHEKTKHRKVVGAGCPYFHDRDTPGFKKIYENKDGALYENEELVGGIE